MKCYLCLFILGLAAVGSFAQTAPPAGDITRVSGEVTAVTAAAHEIALKPDSGGAMTVKLTDKTVYLRVPLGEKDLKNAIPIRLEDIVVGDRILARGRMSEDHGSIEAAQGSCHGPRGRCEEARRGPGGVAKTWHGRRRDRHQSGQPRNHHFGRARGKRRVLVTVEAPAGVTFRRYAPDSVRVHRRAGQLLRGAQRRRSPAGAGRP